MTPFQTIQQTLATDLKRLNDNIASALESPNVLMNNVVSHYLEQKGKQIRPILVLLSARLCGEVTDKVLSGATAVELLHNASLIHDDVVDETMVRRGASTINGVWDNHLAVLVGDFFLSNALLQGVETNDIRVLQSISNLGRLLSIGELDEIYNAHYNELSEETYFKIIYRKTASLFVSCVEVGYYGAGGVDDEQLNTLREFARLLGLCFQIKDDIFDYFSDDKIGKPTGNDLREGKVTLPLLYALSNTGHECHTNMVDLVKKDMLSNEEIATLTAYAIENGGIEYARSCMLKMRNQAVELLRSRFPRNEITDSLVAVFDFIIDRDK